MQYIINEKDKERTNVIYLVTCFVGNHYKEYHYIGLTKRKLEQRFTEHCFKNTAVSKFIKENNVTAISIEVLRECKYEQLLDSAETAEMCKYFLKRGTPNNQRNRLINRDFKGLTDYTLKGVKDILNCLQFS